IIILLAFIFSSCDMINGSGHIQIEKRNVGQFDGVQASGSMDIEVTEGENVSLEVEADDNILRYIITEVNDGLLDVYFKLNISFNNTHTKVYVTAPGLKRLFVKGSGNIVSKNKIQNN